MKPTVLCVAGTRPEAVKMAPVVIRMRREGSPVTCRLLASGQHQGLLDRALGDFGLVPDRTLDLMRVGGGLAELTAKAVVALTDAIRAEKPDLVLAVGDTTTVFASALASFYEKVPFGHIEAGLRSYDRDQPFPEETNREMTARLASIHFAPTVSARDNLLRERIAAGSILLTGNPVIDALRMTAGTGPAATIDAPGERFLLVTAHRRENWGEPMRAIAADLRLCLDRDPTLGVIAPLHPNPEVRASFREALGDHPRARLIEPVGYREFVGLMAASALIASDSGGVQEEGPALGKTVLVLRSETERPEAVACGAARLVGTKPGALARAVAAHFALPGRAIAASLPFGDGWAAERIARGVFARLGIDPGPLPREMPEWPNPRMSEPPAD